MRRRPSTVPLLAAAAIALALALPPGGRAAAPEGGHARAAAQAPGVDRHVLAVPRAAALGRGAVRGGGVGLRVLRWFPAGIAAALWAAASRPKLRLQLEAEPGRPLHQRRGRTRRRGPPVLALI